MTTETQEAPEAAAPEAEAAEPAAPVPFWQRPYVERYLVPLVLPVAIVFGLVLFVTNISRIFLTGHGNVPVILGTVITVAILIGAAALSAAPRMRSGSLTLVGASFVGLIVLFGWMSVGTAEGPKEEGGSALAAEGPALEQLEFVSTGDLKFNPSTAEAPTGIVGIKLTNESGTHTFVFETPGTLFPNLAVDAAGDEDAARAFFGAEGDYVFYCSITGHRQAGMEGAITVTGDPKTIAEAEAELGGEGGAPAESGAEPAA